MCALQELYRIALVLSSSNIYSLVPFSVSTQNKTTPKTPEQISLKHQIQRKIKKIGIEGGKGFGK